MRWLELKKRNSGHAPIKCSPDSSDSLPSDADGNNINMDQTDSEDIGDDTHDSGTLAILPMASHVFDDLTPSVDDCSSCDRAQRIKKGQKLLREWKLRVRRKPRIHGDSLVRTNIDDP